MNFLKPKKSIDFIGKRKIFGAVSAVLVALSMLAFFVIQPNWGIDFTGGTEIQIKFEQAVSIAEMRDALEELGLSGDAVQEVGNADSGEFKIRIQDAAFGADDLRADIEQRLVNEFGANFIDQGRTRFDAEVGARLVVGYNGDQVDVARVAGLLSDIDGATVQEGREERELVIQLTGLTTQVAAEIGKVMGGRTFEVLSSEAVGPKVGGELRRQGFISVLATLGLVLIYIAFRFDLRYAPGAILALIHDVSVTAGVFVLLGMVLPGRFEFNLPMIGALLTIVGYSLNDTIIIYDRIRENRDRYRRKDTAELINVSVNETLARTLATSFTTMLAMTAFLVVGGAVIEDFAFAMMCGIVFGTYSTVYVASPMILVMEDLQPYLGKLVAVRANQELDEEEEAAAQAGMTSAALRRRERAAKQRDGADA
jgi:preprotein translocase subunit SecF